MMKQKLYLSYKWTIGPKPYPIMGLVHSVSLKVIISI